MSVSITEIVARLDSLYGAAYKALTDALGEDVNVYGSAKSAASDMKCIARGGSDKFGVVKGTLDLVVGAYSVATNSVLVNPGSIVVNGVEKQITATLGVNIGTEDINNTTVSADTGFCSIVSVIDYGTTPTISVTKGNLYGYGSSLLNCPVPTYPRHEIPLAKVYVDESDSTISSSEIVDIRPIYDTAPSDAIVTNLFTSLDSTENTMLAKTMFSDWSSGLQAVVNYTRTVTGYTFKEYFRDRAFTSGFKKLYADTYGSDVGQNYCSITASNNISGCTPTYNAPSLYANLIDAYTASGAFAGTTSVIITGVTDTYSNLTSKAAVGDTTIYVDDTTGFPTAGGNIAIYNYDNTFECKAYSAKTASSMTVTALTSAHKTHDKIYNCSNVTAYIPTGTALSTAIAVGTAGTKYLAVAVATMISATVSARVIIRNR